MAELKAVVFDMDDTLLSINLSAFIARLAKDEANLLAKASRKQSIAVFAALTAAMLSLNNGERADSDARTNRRFFNDEMRRRIGIPLDEPAVADMIAYYEREILPDRNDALVSARPREGAPEAIECVLTHGKRIALLTNPSFSRECIETRMGWGRLSDVPFELVTTMENSSRCKPSSGYYLEALGKLGLAPEETLMVGNDPKRDFALPDCGLETAYVGSGSPARAIWSGPMTRFAESFDEIEERFCAKKERGGDA